MKQQHNAVAAGPVETTPGPALEIRTMATPKHDARAVLRTMERIEKRRLELRALETTLAPHASRLCRSQGLVVPLKGPQLKRLADQVAA